MCYRSSAVGDLYVSLVWLSIQLTQQDQFLTQLQQDMNAKSLQHQDTMKQLQLTKKTVAELQDEIDLHQKRDRENGNKLHEQETMIFRLREENENIHQRIRTLKEDIVDRDGQLRVSKMNLDTAHKQMQHLQQQVCYLQFIHMCSVIHKGTPVCNNHPLGWLNARLPYFLDYYVSPLCKLQ